MTGRLPEFSKAEKPDFIPAFGYHALTKPYYALVSGFLGEMWGDTSAWIAANLPEGGSHLDLGAGNARVSAGVREIQPHAKLFALDADPAMQIKAAKNIEKYGIQYHVGYSNAMQVYPDASMDVVSSSVMFHHLDEKAKLETLQEVKRVLKPGRPFILNDFSAPTSGIRKQFMTLLHWFLKEPEVARQMNGSLLQILNPITEQGGSVEDRKIYLGTIHQYLIRFSKEMAEVMKPELPRAA